MTTLLSYLNRLLPFATPGTPLLQDLVHLAAVCTLLYFAPQLQQWHQQRGLREQEAGQDEEAERLRDVDGDDHENLDQDHAEGEDVEVFVAEEENNAWHGAPNVENQWPEPQQHDTGHAPQGEAGLAREPRGPPQRNIGAKKAKALARRDQRRAYNEFQRSQGEAQRARDAEGAAEREAALAAERERRRAAEAALEAKKARKRDARREAERREREVQTRRREMTVAIVREGLEESRMVDLWKVARQVGDDVEEEWIEKILKAAGTIGRKGSEMTMLTSSGWVVRVGEEDMRRVYQMAVEEASNAEDGAITHERVGGLLEATLKGNLEVGG